MVIVNNNVRETNEAAAKNLLDDLEVTVSSDDGDFGSSSSDNYIEFSSSTN